MSLRFPAELRARVKRYAATRGLEEATAVRALCAERLREVELGDDLMAAERWQLSSALESWDRLERGELEIVPRGDIRRMFSAARAAARKSRPRT